MEEVEKIISILSPIERDVLPYLKLKGESKIVAESKMDAAKVKRALGYLDSKGVIKVQFTPKKQVVLGENGILYLKQGLPERRLLTALQHSKKELTLTDAKTAAKLNDQELSISLGALKKKAAIELQNGKISLSSAKQDLTKKTLEEKFLESLPLDFNSLTDEQKFALNNLKNRKDIIVIEESKESSYEITPLGTKILANLDKVKAATANTIEILTPEILRNEGWKNKKFRAYDIKTAVPAINGGKRHFVNQSIEYGRRIWTDLGFKEMSGPMVDNSFWIFDSLFTPQDHPAREMQDTFFISGVKGKLPEKKLVDAVKKSHESGVSGSKGWQYDWKDEVSKKIILRTHTTGLSARTLATISPDQLPAKYFAIGKVFRNETVDWKHSFEFYQTEGIVIDENANFRHLLGYLKEFYTKMGFEKIKFVPSFFAYTEPSVEIQVFHPERKEWLELGGAGMFRPEVTTPLLGKPIPVLAWGQGFDRIIMDYYKIKDLREMYSNNLKHLKEKQFWIK